MTYREWNRKIMMRFFNESMASKEVILYVNESVISEIAKELNQNFNDFISVISEGLDEEGAGLCQKALDIAEVNADDIPEWKRKQDKNSIEYPPYCAILAFFVLAAGKEGEYYCLAYYKRLWNYLGNHKRTDNYPGFEKMRILWKDLEEWANYTMKERLGRFSLRKPYVENWKHVGIPRSQLLLSENERLKLPIFFASAGLDSNETPSKELLKIILSDYGRDYLSRRTKSILEIQSGENLILKDAMLELILDDLINWDGKIPDILMEPYFPILQKEALINIDEAIKLRKHKLKIILDFHGRNKCTFRIKTSMEFPEDGFELENLNKDELIDFVLLCRETSNPGNKEGQFVWSKPLVYENNGKISFFNVSNLDWTKSYEFVDYRRYLLTSFKGSEIRLFKRGASEGLSGWIETENLQRDSRFYLSCHKKLEYDITEWGEGSCEHFKKLSFSDIPEDWILFKGLNALKSLNGIANLTLSDSVHLKVRGGFRLSKGNDFLNTVPPSFQILNGSGQEHLICYSQETNSEVELLFDRDTQCFYFPADLNLKGYYNVKLINLKKSLELRNILIEFHEPHISDNINLCKIPKENSFGENIFNDSSAENYVSCLTLKNSLNVEENFEELPIWMVSNKLILIGAKCGEIYKYNYKNNQNLKINWKPVWLLHKTSKKEWETTFTGSFIEASESPENSILSRKTHQQRKWVKSILFTPNLKKPVFKEVRQLWDYYEKKALMKWRSWNKNV